MKRIKHFGILASISVILLTSTMVVKADPHRTPGWPRAGTAPPKLHSDKLLPPPCNTAKCKRADKRRAEAHDCYRKFDKSHSLTKLKKCVQKI